MTLSRRDVLDLLARHGLRPSRALGQNFVVDPNTVRRIARLASIGEGDQVVEIGAGLGSLTLALCERGASVVTVERDRHLLPVLREIAEPAGATVIEGDALTLDWPVLLRSHGGGNWALVANLPYNVATPLVLDLLEGVQAIDRMLVMVQREVAERLAATVGSHAYGAVSVKLAWWAKARLVGSVPPTVFVPKPRVASELVAIVRHPKPIAEGAIVEYERFREAVNAGFAHRRKMLRGSLLGVVEAAAFEAVGVSPKARAEDLDLTAWARLAGWHP